MIDEIKRALAETSARDWVCADSLFYLATPYTKHPQGIVVAFEEAAALAARLLVKGLRVYSPIAHCHPLSVHGGVNPRDHAVWLPFDEAMMHRADGLLVAEMNGWQRSFGVAHEIRFFTQADKPVVYLDPERLVVSATPGAVTLPAEEPLR